MQEIKVIFFPLKVQEKQLETEEWKKKYEKLHGEYKEMGYEFTLIFTSMLFLPSAVSDLFNVFCVFLEK